MFKFIYLFVLLFISHYSLAFVPSGDNKYLIFEADQYRIIFDEQYLDSIDEINKKIEAQFNFMSKFKNRTLDEPVNIILLSSKSQISNGFATVAPFYTIGMYPTGVLAFDTLSESSWFDGLLEHELNHVFQLSHSRFSSFWRKIFRLPSFLFAFIVLPLTPYPNMFLPRFILEGDSILKESLSPDGGRLYSGAARAFVYSQVKHYQHQIDWFKRRKMLTPRWGNPHFGKEIYLHGGYLMAMLAEKYSHKTIHSFFKVDRKKPKRAEIKEIRKLSVEDRLSSKFGELFSFKYIYLFIDDLLQSYFNHYLSSAVKQQSSTTPVLFESATCPVFNQDKEEVFFLTSKDMKSTPVLKRFNKKNREWMSEKIDLPNGKVFKIDNKYYSRSSEKIAPNTIHYSLFSKGLKSDKSFESKYVTDLKDGKVLYIDTKNNLTGFKLYLNNEFYSDVHSNALFDKYKNVYYFKQKGSRRVLYRNKKSIFSYSGYYGNLLQIDEKGAVYFTGASPYGSSIYEYRSGVISRVSESDTIIQAIKINNKEFLTCEITPYKYEYKIIPLIKSRQQPVLYKYRFKKHKSLLSKNEEHSDFINKKVVRKVASQKQGKVEHSSVERSNENALKANVKKPKTASVDYKPYSSLKSIRFNGGNFVAMSVGISSVLSMGISLSDYLMQNILQLIGAGVFIHFDEDLNFDFTYANSQILFINYLNRKYRLEWGLGYGLLAENGEIWEQNVTVNFQYPLFKKGRWFSSLSSLHSLERRSSIMVSVNDGEVEEEIFTSNAYHSRGYFNIGYSQKFPFNYFYSSNKASFWQVFVDHKFRRNDTEQQDWDAWKFGVIWDSSWQLWKDFYWIPEASYSRTLNQDINPVKVALYRKALPEDFDNDLGINKNQILSGDDTEVGSFVNGDIYGALMQSHYLAQSVGTLSMGFKHMFTVPVGLLIPSVRSRWVILENLSSYKSVPLLDQEGISTGLDIYRDIASDVLQLYGDRGQETLKSTYTQWLEWTFGLEYVYQVRVGLWFILGASYGFRTPVKFWETQEGESGKPTLEDEYGTWLESSPYSQVYFKVPF